MKKKIKKLAIFLNRTRPYQYLLSLLLLVITGGCFFVWWAALKTEKDLRQEILARTMIIAEAVNPSRIMTLKGSMDDIHSPDYLRLKEQLNLVCKVIPLCRELYLVGQKNGEFIIHVDSEKPDSENYSPPGKLFDESSDTIENIFYSGNEALICRETEGHSSITAMVPIYNREHRIIALLCMDINSSGWVLGVLENIFAPIIFTVFISTTILFFYFFYKRSEETGKLIALSAKYTQLVLEGADLATWEWNVPSGRMTYNKRFATMLGYKPGEIEESNLAFLEKLHPDEKKLLLDGLKAHMDGLSPYYEAEHRMRDKSGAWIWVSDKGKITEYNHEGLPVRVSGILMNITDRKTAEEERLALERRLQLSHRMESLGLLAGGVAHDFNNILGALQGYAEMALEKIEKERPDHPACENLKQVIKAGSRASDLVKQILAFSRQSDPQRMPVEADILIRETLKLLEASIPADILIKTSIPKKLGKVLADPVQIHQIVMNLCANALHSMSKKGGNLDISLARSAFGSKTGNDPEGDYLRLTVTDTGTGISREIISKIFDPFFTTKKPGEGTGLGLSVVHGIVISCDGYIMVDSVPGAGSSFYVYLPVCENREENIEMPDKTVKLSRKNIRVLLVDDEQPLLEMLTERLCAAGFSVTAKNDPIAAVNIFKKNTGIFDLVITDHFMPGTTGLEFAETIHYFNPEIPVILISGFGTEIAKSELKETGIKGIICKPVIFNELFISIKKIFESDES